MVLAPRALAKVGSVIPGAGRELRERPLILCNRRKPAAFELIKRARSVR